MHFRAAFNSNVLWIMRVQNSSVYLKSLLVYHRVVVEVQAVAGIRADDAVMIEL